MVVLQAVVDHADGDARAAVAVPNVGHVDVRPHGRAVLAGVTEGPLLAEKRVVGEEPFGQLPLQHGFDMFHAGQGGQRGSRFQCRARLRHAQDVMAWRIGNFRSRSGTNCCRQSRDIRPGGQPHEHLTCEHAASPLGARAALGIQHQVANVCIANRPRPQLRVAAGHGLGTVAGEVVQLIFGDDIYRGLTGAGTNSVFRGLGCKDGGDEE